MQPLHPPERPLDTARAAPSPARVLEGWFARGGRPASDDTTMSVPLVAQAWSRYLAQAEHVGAIALDATSMPLDRIELFEAALAFVRAVADADPATARDLARAGSTAEPLEPRAHVEGLLLRATALDATGELASAATLLAEAFARVSDIADPALRVAVLVSRGRVLVMLGDESVASAVLHEGVALASALGAKRQEAKMLGNLGFLHGEQDGRSYEAYTARALAIGRELGDERLVVHSLCNLGGALAQQGRFEESRACYAEGLPRAEALDWKQSVALFQAGLGGVEVGTGDVDAGLALYAASTAYFEAAGDSFQVARHHLIVGRHLVAADRHEAARGTLGRCLALCEGDRFRTLAWQAQDLLSTVHERQGEPSRALASLRSAHALREALLEARVSERLRLLDLHVEAERAAREVLLERARSRALQSALDEQRKLQAEVEALARTDSLTQLSNRRHLTEIVHRELSYIRRRFRPLTLVLIDVDHFKQVNDRLGHAAGDRVLVELAARLSGGLREHDWVGRWGGEEFCVVLIDTAEAQGELVARRLLDKVRGRDIETEAGPLRVTVSAGLASWRTTDGSIDDLLRRADAALYEAKRGGRDRVVTAP